MVDVVGRRLREEVPTTVVVHSRYGVLASMLAERWPGRVRRIVYVASYMLGDGETALGAFRRDRDSHLTPFVETSRLGLWDRLRPEAYVEGLYADCSEDDIQLASSLLCPEPSRPALERLSLGPAFASVPRAYVRLSRDRAVTPALQDRLIERTPPERVETIEASHSAYFSKPEELAATLLAVDRD